MNRIQDTDFAYKSSHNKKSSPSKPKKKRTPKTKVTNHSTIKRVKPKQ